MSNESDGVQPHHELMLMAAPADPQPQPVTTPAPAGQSKPNSILKSSAGAITREERLQMIAEAAYFMAKERGFEPGHDMEDWLAAEVEVDTHLSGGTPLPPDH